MGPPSYMRSVVDRNVVMRRIPVLFKKALVFMLSMRNTWQTFIRGTLSVKPNTFESMPKSSEIYAYTNNGKIISPCPF